MSSSEVSSDSASYDYFSLLFSPSSSKPESKISASDPPTFEFSLASFVIGFDSKVFEHHLKAAKSHLKDDLIHSSYSSRTHLTSFSEFSSYLRMHNAIKEVSAILDKEIDQILYCDSKDRNKTSAKVFKNELSNNSFETSIDFTSCHINFDFSEECSIV